MIFNIERQQRNYNYLEIIRGFNKAFETYGEDKVFNKRDFYSFTEYIKGMDSVEEIYEALLPNEQNIEDPNQLELFYKTGEDKYHFSKSSKILPVASKEEVVAIYSMLKNGDLDLYLNESVKSSIESNLEKYFENIETSPVNINDYIVNKGVSKSKDSIERIKDIFHTIQSAIHNKQFVNFEYNKRGIPINTTVFPVEIVFSQLDECFRLKANCDDNKNRTFYLSYINNLKLLNEKPFNVNERLETTKVLAFEFKNEKGLPERVCSRFSDYKKQIKFIQDKNIITYRIEYLDTPLERNRVISRLLSLGSNIKITSEEKNIVKTKAKKALELYK